MESSRSGKESGDIAIPVREVKSSKSGKGAPPVVVAAPIRLGQGPRAGGWKRGVGIIDLILRVCAIVATLAAAAVMGTTSQNLPFFTQLFQFQASYDDFPTFTGAVVGSFLAVAILVVLVVVSAAALRRN
nr:casparian strip membrane protein 1-like [Tanacetum cinerariifolium]